MQERLIALVAEHLLDRNDEERMAAAGSTEEFRLNLARNVADAIDLLPKLVRTVCLRASTRIDFHGPRLSVLAGVSHIN